MKSRFFFWLLTAIVPLVLCLIFLLVGITQIETKLRQHGFHSFSRTMENGMIRWSNLGHSSYPAEHLSWQLVSWPPEIEISGISINHLPQIPQPTKIAPTSLKSSFIAPKIIVTNIELSLPYLPKQIFAGSLYPPLALASEHFQIDNQLRSLNIKGTYHIQNEHFSGDVEVKLHNTQLELQLQNITITHPLLEKEYSLPPIIASGEREQEKLLISGHMAETDFVIKTTLNNFHSDIQANIRLASILQWFDIERFFRNKDFTTQGYFRITSHWKNFSLKSLQVEPKEIDFQGDIFPVQQMLYGGIQYHPINGDQTKILGPMTKDWVPFSELGWIKEAVVAAEDSQFFNHEGINQQGLQEAIDSCITDECNGGGSSITQQLAKNIFLSNQRSIERKLCEYIYTLALEKYLTKENIITLYLNAIEFAPNVYGIQAAADFYFLKSPNNLSITEAAFLASILPNPKRGYEKAIQQKVNMHRIHLIIDNIYNGKAISLQQKTLAQQETLRIVPNED